MNSGGTSNTGYLNTEIVIVGGGGAGLAAAVAAGEQGAHAILLEKRHALGGNSAMAGGLFGAESPVQKRMMIDASRDQLFKAAMEYSHWRINPWIVRAYIDKSGDTIRWLEEKGLQFDHIPVLYPNQVPRTWHCPNGGGAALLKVLAKNCEDLDVQLFPQTAAKRILSSEKGGVAGVVAVKEEKEFTMNARCIIIATGGYAGNKELLKKYYPSYNENMELLGLPHMGEGLLMATEIGAATEGLGLVQLNGARFPGSHFLSAIVGEPSLILVNKKGERFVDESYPYYFEQGNAVDRQPDKICYALFDNKVKQYIIEDGLKRVGPGLPKVNFLQPKIEQNELEKELQSQADKGKVKISDSLGEIAKWIGVATEVLKATIDEYNFFCDRGHDEIFVKDQRYLMALRTPPYYTIKCHSGFLGTLGGIKINQYMEVLDGQDNPIPGLYAAGADTGGWVGDTYSARHLAGCAFGFAINSGRIGGENAAKYLLGRYLR